MGKKNRAARKVVRVKRKPVIPPDELLETAESLGMTAREYVAYLNQRRRKASNPKATGFRGSYTKKPPVIEGRQKLNRD